MTSLTGPGPQVYVDLDKPAWPDLKQMAETIAAARGVRLIPATRGQLGFRSADPDQYGLCAHNKFVLSVSTYEDPGTSTLFEPTGEWYIVLGVATRPLDDGGVATLRELLAAINARWPGTRFQTDLYLNRSFRRETYDREACRTKAARRQYADCLGERSGVRGEALYVHGETRDNPRLQSVLQAFAASHGMTFKTNPTFIAGLKGETLCAAGKVLIRSDVQYGSPGGPPVRQAWGVQIDTYVPADDPEQAAVIDALVAALEAEWPEVRRSRPDLNFCRAMKARK